MPNTRPAALPAAPVRSNNNNTALVATPSQPGNAFALARATDWDDVFATPLDTNHGTDKIAYRPHRFFAEYYDSISAQTEYRKFSVEELRVADYARGNKGINWKKDPNENMFLPAFWKSIGKYDNRRGKDYLALYVSLVLRGSGLGVKLGQWQAGISHAHCPARALTGLLYWLFDSGY